MCARKIITWDAANFHRPSHIITCSCRQRASGCLWDKLIGILGQPNSLSFIISSLPNSSTPCACMIKLKLFQFITSTQRAHTILDDGNCCAAVAALLCVSRTRRECSLIIALIFKFRWLLLVYECVAKSHARDSVISSRWWCRKINSALLSR